MSRIVTTLQYSREKLRVYRFWEGGVQSNYLHLLPKCRISCIFRFQKHEAYLKEADEHRKKLKEDVKIRDDELDKVHQAKYDLEQELKALQNEQEKRSILEQTVSKIFTLQKVSEMHEAVALGWNFWPQNNVL